jgi:hypothetical protein
MSFVNKIVLTKYKAGIEVAKPKMTAGMTNMKLYKTIMLIIPLLLSPTILMIPNSNVLLSTLIISKL